MLLCFNTMKGYVMVDALLTCGKRLYVHIITSRRATWDHMTSLIPPHCIEVPVPSQASLPPCVLWVSMLHLFLRFFRQIFRQIDIYFFYFTRKNNQHANFRSDQKLSLKYEYIAITILSFSFQHYNCVLKKVSWNNKKKNKTLHIE